MPVARGKEMRWHPIFVSFVVVSLLVLDLASASRVEAGSPGWFFGNASSRRTSRRQRTRLRRAQQRKQIKKNAKVGRRRDRWATFKWRLLNPLSSIQKERYLLTRKGEWAEDRKGKARRFDIAVIGPSGRLRALVEVTGKRTDKTAQKAKTDEILRRYRKLFVEDRRTGRLIPVRRGWILPTRIVKDGIAWIF